MVNNSLTHWLLPSYRCCVLSSRWQPWTMSAPSHNISTWQWTACSAWPTSQSRVCQMWSLRAPLRLSPLLCSWTCLWLPPSGMNTGGTDGQNHRWVAEKYPLQGFVFVETETKSENCQFFSLFPLQFIFKTKTSAASVCVWLLVSSPLSACLSLSSFLCFHLPVRSNSSSRTMQGLGFITVWLEQIADKNFPLYFFPFSSTLSLPFPTPPPTLHIPTLPTVVHSFT